MFKQLLTACLILAAPLAHAEIEQTLSIIKPNAVRDNNVGNILSRLEQHDLNIIAIKKVHLTKEQAGSFYHVHKDKPFFNDTTDFMSSGPIYVTVLEGDNAISRYRELMGPTDPKKAPEGTLRADFATFIGENAVHGSDAPETAKEEIAFFFSTLELHA